jgi:hypothetical protein
MREWRTSANPESVEWRLAGMSGGHAIIGTVIFQPD